MNSSKIGSLEDIVLEAARRIRQSDDAPLPGPLLVTVTSTVAVLPAAPLVGFTLSAETTKSGNCAAAVIVKRNKIKIDMCRRWFKSGIIVGAKVDSGFQRE